MLSGREFALPDDLQALAVPVLAHRLLLTAQAQMNRRTAEQVVVDILQRTRCPRWAGSRRSARTTASGTRPAAAVMTAEAPAAGPDGPVRGGLRGAFGGLTTRGRSFLAAGMAAAVCAYVLGQTDLLRVGLLLAVLPLVCVAVLYRTRYRVTAARRLAPQRVPADPRRGCSCAWTTSPGSPPDC